MLKLYDQLWNSINSHLLVVWQSLGLVIGAFAILALVEKQVIPIDWAVTLIVILSGWLIANVIDASYWYNRNLVIIGNIEREFLNRDDDRKISYYFIKHRETNKMIIHFKIQLTLGLGIFFVIIIYHMILRLLPAINNKPLRLTYLPISSITCYEAPYVLNLSRNKGKGVIKKLSSDHPVNP